MAGHPIQIIRAPSPCILLRIAVAGREVLLEKPRNGFSPSTELEVGRIELQRELNQLARLLVEKGSDPVTVEQTLRNLVLHPDAGLVDIDILADLAYRHAQSIRYPFAEGVNKILQTALDERHRHYDLYRRVQALFEERARV